MLVEVDEALARTAPGPAGLVGGGPAQSHHASEDRKTRRRPAPPRRRPRHRGRRGRTSTTEARQAHQRRRRPTATPAGRLSSASGTIVGLRDRRPPAASTSASGGSAGGSGSTAPPHPGRQATRSTSDRAPSVLTNTAPRGSTAIPSPCGCVGQVEAGRPRRATATRRRRPGCSRARRGGGRRGRTRRRWRCRRAVPIRRSRLGRSASQRSRGATQHVAAEDPLGHHQRPAGCAGHQQRLGVLRPAGVDQLVRTSPSTSRSPRPTGTASGRPTRGCRALSPMSPTEHLARPPRRHRLDVDGVAPPGGDPTVSPVAGRR